MTRVTLLRRFLRTAALTCLAGVGSTARAQPRLEVINRGAVAPPPLVLNDATFDQWALGASTTLGSVEQRLKDLLKNHIEQIDRACKLTGAQKARLQLAGQGDIKRLHDRIEEKRWSVVGVPQDRARLNEILRELQPLRIAIQSDPFGEGSIFEKTIKTHLKENQFQQYRNDVDERLRFRHQAAIDMVVAMFDRRAGLTGEQRRQFAQVLRRSTRPPRRSGPYDYYVMMIQAADAPEEALKPIFDDAQWASLRHQMQQARATEQTLRTQGYLPDLTRSDTPVAAGPRAGAP